MTIHIKTAEQFSLLVLLYVAKDVFNFDSVYELKKRDYPKTDFEGRSYTMLQIMLCKITRNVFNSLTFVRVEK